VRSVAVACLAVVAGLVLPAPAAHADWVREDQYQLRALDVATAWRYSTGDSVIVAVLDSGVDATHPDLAGQVLPGADFVDGTTDGRRDLVGHGTTVAGLIAGRNDDAAGVAGIAPGARILPVRVLDAANKYDDATVVAAGLKWAVDHGAKVANVSLGGNIRSDALAEALAYAADHDVVVIACTGNVAAGAPATEVWYPAREPGVVAVAGLADEETGGVAAGTGGTAGGGGAGGGSEALWSGSLTGPQTVLTAPAVNLIGARPGGYWKVQGTSFAAPLVAATATLIRSRWPGMDAPNVINRLIRTAKDLGVAGRDDRYGYGEVSPVPALTAEVVTVRRNPLDRHAAEVDKAIEGLRGRLPARSAPAVRAKSREPARIDAVLTPLRVALSVTTGVAVFLLLLLAGAAAVRRFLARRP
jgi:subtilisin family serine protease